jgi:hypothetical protein
MAAPATAAEDTPALSTVATAAVGTMPDANTGRTSWNRPAKKGGIGGGGGRSLAGSAYRGGGRSAGIQQRWRKHDEGQRETYSGCDAGGSAANTVRRLPIHS